MSLFSHASSQDLTITTGDLGVCVKLDGAAGLIALAIALVVYIEQ
jgi:hypothetical protein